MPEWSISLGIPALFLAQAILLVMMARYVAGGRASLMLLPALLTWGLASACMATSGVYDTQDFLSLLPGLWLPAVPFFIVLMMMLVPSVRRAVARVAVETPAHWLVGIQALRIAAIGTLLQTMGNEFPLHVELSIGLTDLVFGLSALIVFKLARSASISDDALIIWHLVGFLIIIVPGEWAIQAGLPGALAAYDYAGPHSSAPMLDFPMVLAPSLVVPIFLMLNLLGAFGAYKRRLAASHSLKPQTEQLP